MGSGDFVFKEHKEGGGKLQFVGDFEGLYQADKDPWAQSGADCPSEVVAYYSLSRRRLFRALRPKIGQMDDFCGLEVGCGHGYVVDILNSIPVPLKSNWEGMDISEAAVARARELFPQYEFFTGDLTLAGPALDDRAGQYAVVVLGQVWWYLLHRLQISLNNCYKIVRPGGLLVISQAFLQEQRYGVDVANGFTGALAVFQQSHMKCRWRLLETHYDDMLPGEFRDGLIILRKI